MGFWDTYNASEAELARTTRADAEALWMPPDECLHCHQIKPGVMLGICTDCFIQHERRG